MVAQQEGIIKFRMDHTPAPALPAEAWRELNAWRRILHMTGMIGRDPARYDGYNYGNVSRRLPPFEAPPTERAFVITGAQTSGLPHLGPEHFVYVRACYTAENRVVSEGPLWPSSETMTHAALYAADPALRFVVHAHSPEIWCHADALGLPMTSPDVPYGCPEMSEEVLRLYADPAARALGIFGMGGHDEGLLAFGPDAETAVGTLLRFFARGLQIAG